MVELFILAALLAQDPPPLPVPDAEAQKQAEKLIRDVFKDDYARTSKADRVAFVRKLIDQSHDTKDDPAARFVLLREARDVAAAAGDADLAYNIIASMSVYFTLRPIPLKHGALQDVAKAARTPEEIRMLVGYYLRLIDESLDEDDYDVAPQAAASAATWAKNSKDVPLVSKASARSREVAELKERYAKVKTAEARIAAQPADAAANGLIGLHKCFVRNDWEAGLPFLAKTDDADLKALAALELAPPTDPVEQASIGDAWWERADMESGRIRENLRWRGGVWYERAYARLTGLTRAKVEKRISDFYPGRPKGDWLDVGDPRLFGFAHCRFGEEFVLLAALDRSVALKLKQFPEGDFDGLSARIRFGPNRMAIGGLSFENRTGYVLVNGGQNQVFITHKEGDTWITDRVAPCAKADEYLLSVVITKGDYVVTVNGEEKFKAKAAPSTFRHLWVYGKDGTVLVDRMHLRRKE